MSRSQSPVRLSSEKRREEYSLHVEQVRHRREHDGDTPEEGTCPFDAQVVEHGRDIHGEGPAYEASEDGVGGKAGGGEDEVAFCTTVIGLGLSFGMREGQATHQ